MSDPSSCRPVLPSPLSLLRRVRLGAPNSLDQPTCEDDALEKLEEEKDFRNMKIANQFANIKPIGKFGKKAFFCLKMQIIACFLRR